MKRKNPQRMCVGCRQMKDKKDLIRVIRTEDGVHPDLSGKAGGRGAYLCRSTECLNAALKNKSLERALKTGIAAEQLAEEMKKEIETG